MKILEFHARIKKKKKILEFQRQTFEKKRKS